MNTRAVFSALFFSLALFAGRSYGADYGGKDPVMYECTRDFYDDSEPSDSHHEGSIMIGAGVGLLAAWMNARNILPFSQVITASDNFAMKSKDPYLNNIVVGLFVNQLCVALLHYDSNRRYNSTQSTSHALALISQLVTHVFAAKALFGSI